MKVKTGYSSFSLGALVYLFVIVILTFSLVTAYFPFFRREWILWLSALVVSIAVSPSVYRTHRFYILMLYALVLVVNVAMGDVYFKENVVIREICYLWIPAVIYQYCITGEKGNRFSFLVVATIIIIILIESISTFFLDLANPSILRSSFSEALETSYDRESYMTQYYKLGMSNYSLPHALPILIPASIYGIKANGGGIRIIWFLFLLASLLLCWLSGSSTALMMATFITIVALLTKIGNVEHNVKVLVLLFVLILPLFYIDSISLWFLDIIERLVSDNSYFMSKVTAFRETIIYGDAMGDVASRQELYLKSFDLFKSNALLGTNEAVGNHSTLIDRLSVLGLLGFAIYIVFLYRQFQFTKRSIGRHSRIFYIEGVIVGILLLLLKDMDNWETFLALFTVLPLQIRLVEKITT